MRLGATIGEYGVFEDPDAYVNECGKWGYRAAPCPKVRLDEADKLRAIKRAFTESRIAIAEVQAWVNPLDPRESRRQENLNAIAESLCIADEVGAVCCVTVAGSFDISETACCDSPHPANFANSTFDAVVEWVHNILRDVKPQHAKLTLEMSPWTVLDGPEVYRELVETVDHPMFGVHLDPANAVCNAHIYYSTTDLVNLCFDLLGQWVVGCHAKDIIQGPTPNTVMFNEVLPGRGVVDYRTFLTRIEQVSADTPLIIEHLTSVQEYSEAAEFIRGVARELGATS